MTIKVHIGSDGFADSVKVWVVNASLDTYDQVQRVLRFNNDEFHSYTWVNVEQGVDVDPTFTLMDDAARALLESLVRHYNGAEDTRQLRADYNSERTRVDGLIKTLGQVVLK